jgi:hypothetical protein
MTETRSLYVNRTQARDCKWTRLHTGNNPSKLETRVHFNGWRLTVGKF